MRASPRLTLIATSLALLWLWPGCSGESGTPGQVQVLDCCEGGPADSGPVDPGRVPVDSGSLDSGAATKDAGSTADPGEGDPGPGAGDSGSTQPGDPGRDRPDTPSDGGADLPEPQADYLIDPPDPCYSAFWVEGCQEGDASTACGGVCAVANACSPPEWASKADLEMTFMCPRAMMLSPEMIRAVRDDARRYGWEQEEPFTYAVAGHDSDPLLDGGAQSTCCQCYQLVYESPEPGSPKPPELPIPKPVIAQSFNTAAGGPKNFDLFMGAGGYGAFNACFEDPLFGNNSTFGRFVYDSFPVIDSQSGNGNVTFVSLEECKAEHSVTMESLQSDACRDRILELCNEATAGSPATTEATRRSCIGTNSPDSLYHQNWKVRVRKVACPEHLTRVTGCRLDEPLSLPPPDPDIRTVADIPEGDTSWTGEGYHTTTMQDCCKPSCAWSDWVEGKGLVPHGDWNAFYSCDQAGEPFTKP